MYVYSQNLSAGIILVGGKICIFIPTQVNENYWIILNSLAAKPFKNDNNWNKEVEHQLRPRRAKNKIVQITMTTSSFQYSQKQDLIQCFSTFFIPRSTFVLHKISGPTTLFTLYSLSLTKPCINSWSLKKQKKKKKRSSLGRNAHFTRNCRWRLQRRLHF